LHADLQEGTFKTPLETICLQNTSILRQPQSAARISNHHLTAGEITMLVVQYKGEDTES